VSASRASLDACGRLQPRQAWPQASPAAPREGWLLRIDGGESAWWLRRRNRAWGP